MVDRIANSNTSQASEQYSDASNLINKFASVFDSINSSLIENNTLLNEISVANVEERKIEETSLGALNRLIELQEGYFEAFKETQEALRRAALLGDRPTEASDPPQSQPQTSPTAPSLGIGSLGSIGDSIGQFLATTIGALSISGLGAAVLSGGVRGAIGFAIGNFLQGAVERGLEDLGVDETIASSIGEGLKTATIWGAIGSIFGRRFALIAAAGGLLATALENVLDENEDGIINAFGQEFDASTVAAIGGLLGSYLGTMVLGRIGSSLLARMAGGAAATAAGTAAGTAATGGAAATAGTAATAAGTAALALPLILGAAGIGGGALLDEAQRRERAENIAEFEAAAGQEGFRAEEVAQEEDIPFFRRLALSAGLATPQTTSERLDDLRRTTEAAARNLVTGGTDALTGEAVVADTETKTALRNTLTSFIGDTDLNTLSDRNLSDISAIARQIDMPNLAEQIERIRTIREDADTANSARELSEAAEATRLSAEAMSSIPVTQDVLDAEQPTLAQRTEAIEQESRNLSSLPAPVIVRGGDSVAAPITNNTDNSQTTVINRFIEPTISLNHVPQ